MTNEKGRENPKIIVELDDWAQAEGPTLLETRGLGPCFGVVIYNPRTETGYMGHFPAPHITGGKLLDMLDAATAEDGTNPAELLVWIRGGEQEPELDEESASF